MVVELGSPRRRLRLPARWRSCRPRHRPPRQTLEGADLQQLAAVSAIHSRTFTSSPRTCRYRRASAYAGNLQGFHIDGCPTRKIGFFQDGAYCGRQRQRRRSHTAQTIQSTVEEVKVLAHHPPAEYGHSAAVRSATVQRTGTNTLHGEVREFGASARCSSASFSISTASGSRSRADQSRRRNCSSSRTRHCTAPCISRSPRRPQQDVLSVSPWNE